jgi:hypothetical protein
MENQIDNKTSFFRANPFVVAVLVLAITAISMLIWQIWLGSPKMPLKQEPVLQNPSPLTPLEGQIFLPPGQLPEGITQNMILADDAKIIQSYEYVDKNKKIKQSTLKYSTSAELPKIYDVYFSKLLKKGGVDGFTMLISDNINLQGRFFSLRGIKPSGTLDIRANSADGFTGSIVELTLILPLELKQ